MTAGTVVITGGILATVILLFIIAVLCYCRLQYYCCKKHGSDTGSITQPQFSCSVAGLDGLAVTPLSLSLEPPAAPDPSGGRRGYCPTCSPYDSPFYLRGVDEMRNGGERITYMPTFYENQALAMPLPALHPSLLREARRAQQPDLYANTRAISTEV
ncbi:protein FAM163A [Polymixia lowei]